MADTYGDLADFKDWADARGHEYPEADSEIEAALLRATDYLERAYRGRWKGTKAHGSQPLSWPRAGVRDEDGRLLPDDEVPQQLVDASYEAARRVLDGVDLEPDLERGGKVKRKRESVGPITEETEYFDGASARASYTGIDGLLSGLLRSTAMVWLERV